jgi:hypothetical protein
MHFAWRMCSLHVRRTRASIYGAVAAQGYSACHLRHDSARSMHMRVPSFQVPHQLVKLPG